MTRRSGNRNLWLLTGGTFYAFFIFGFTDNLKGPTLPALLADLRLDYRQGGTILLGAYAGFLLATLLTGLLADRAGKKAVIFVAGASLLIGIAGYSSFSALWPLIAAITLFGFGLGAIELGCNAFVVEVYPHKKGQYLNLLAVFHGLGSVIAPFFAGRLLSSDYTWRQVYQLCLIPTILLPLYFLFLRFPKGNGAKTQKTGFAPSGKRGMSRGIWWYYFLVAVYVAAEIGIGAWLVEFLQKVKYQSVLLSSSYLSLFFGCLLAGRLLGSFLVERIGYLRIMFFAALASVICITVGVLAPPALAFFFPLTGLFLSIIFPTATAAFSNLFQGNVGAALGLFFAFAGLGGMLGPSLVGFLSDCLGIRLGFGAIPFFCILMAFALLMLHGSEHARAHPPLEARPFESTTCGHE